MGIDALSRDETLTEHLNCSVISVTLPLPPSANALFRNLKGRGRVKTEGYKAWIDDAAWHVKRAWQDCGKPEISEQPMRLDIELGLTDRRRDATNCVKAIEDLLCACLPVPDDRWNDHIVIRRTPEADGMARVTLAPLDST